MNNPSVLTGNFSGGKNQRLILGSLFSAILLNLFLVAALVLPPMMNAHRHGNAGPMSMGRPHGEYYIENIAGMLSASDAEAFKKVYPLYGETLKSAHEDIRTAMEEVTEAFEKENADPQALTDAFHRLNLAHERLQSSMQGLVADLYKNLSAEGRHRLSELKRDRML